MSHLTIQTQTSSENDETDKKEETDKNEKLEKSTAKFMETWNLDLPRFVIEHNNNVRIALRVMSFYHQFLIIGHF